MIFRLHTDAEIPKSLWAGMTSLDTNGSMEWGCYVRSYWKDSEEECTQGSLGSENKCSVCYVPRLLSFIDSTVMMLVAESKLKVQTNKAFYIEQELSPAVSNYSEELEAMLQR